MEIILKDVDPRLFNLVASVLAEVLQLAGAFCLCAVMHLMVSIYVRKGNKIPVDALGPLPSGLIDAMQYAISLKWAWPATFALILFVSDYSTAIAFAGLDFVELDQKGEEASVLNLARRNVNFPYGAIGDPVLPLTTSKLELLLETSSAFDMDFNQISKLAHEDSVISSFLDAADAIARGESVFLDQNEELSSNPALLVVGQAHSGTFGQLTDSMVLYSSNDASSLAAIDLAIPLHCNGDSMVTIEEQQGYDDWTTTSQVPDCVLTAPRPSGIYGTNSEKAEITAFVKADIGAETKLYFEGQKDKPINFQERFAFPHNGGALAKERQNFRQGRQVFGFGGVQLGDIDIPFGVTLLSRGQDVPFPPEELNFSSELSITEDQRTLQLRPKAQQYSLVAEVVEAEKNCPKDPSGSTESSCMVTTTIICNTFLSEQGRGGSLFDAGAGGPVSGGGIWDTFCVLDGSVEIIWGEKYQFDSQLLAVVAGIRSRNFGWALTSRQKNTLSIHSLPAALFMLGVLDSSPSVKQVKSTTINGVFITFMCLPVCLCVFAGCVYLIGQKYLLPLPEDAVSMIDLGVQFAQQPSCNHDHNEYGTLLWDGNSLCLDGMSHGKGNEENEQHEIVFEESEEASEEKKFNNDTEENNKALYQEEENEEDDCETGVQEDENLNNAATEDILNQKESSPGVESSTEKHTAQTNVFGCIFFCVTVAMIATAFIRTHSVDSESTAKAPQDQSTQSVPELKVVPQGCFRNNFELGTAIRGYAHGSDEHSKRLTHQYGPISEWCVQYVDDFSFLFAGIQDGRQLNVSSWNTSGVKRFDHCFYGFDFSRNILDVSNWDVSSGTNFGGMFTGAPRFNGDLSQWDVSSGEDFRGMFFADVLFDSDLSQWNVSSGIKFSQMFANATRFSSDLSLWNVSSGRDFSIMFQRCSRFNSDLSGWDVSLGSTFSGMFQSATRFNSDLSQWDMWSATNLYGMFYEATRFNSDLSQWNVSSVSDFQGLFYNASRFNSDLSQWNVSSGKTFSYMFFSATSFNSELSDWDVSGGEDFEAMFEGAASFSSDLSKWDVSSGRNFFGMFNGALPFKSDLSKWDVSSGRDFNSMFKGCRDFSSDVSGWDVSSGVDFAGMFQEASSFNSNISTWDVSSGTDFRFMFAECIQFNSDISQWDVSSGKYFTAMFSEATAFDSDLSQWDVSSGSDFSFMFSEARLFNADLSDWDVALGQDFAWMFYSAASYNADLSQWDVSSSVDFTGMFSRARSFTSDLSTWEVSLCSSFFGMFSQAVNFTSDLSQWDVSSGTNFQQMFFDAYAFTSDLSQWDVSSSLTFGAMFFDARSFNSDLSKWDVSSSKSFSGMFSGAVNFTSDLSEWDVSAGRNFRDMFFVGIFNSDLSKWDVSSGENFANMFSQSKTFDSDLSQWDVSSGRDFSGMFSFCTNFNSDLSKWDVSSGSSFNRMFGMAANFNSDLSMWDVSSGTDFSWMFAFATTFTSDLSQWDVSSSNTFDFMFSGASSFYSDLCLWQDSIGPGDSTAFMFLGTSCPYQLSVSSETMCAACPTPSPTQLPSQSPSNSPAPSVSNAPSMTETRQIIVGGAATIPIPPNGSSGSQTINLSVSEADQDCEIADLDVILRLQHTWAEDLEVALCHPDGTCVRLFADIGQQHGFYIARNVTIDDEAPENIASAILGSSENPIGTPESDSLSKFDGKRVLGVWELYINDDNAGDSGYFYFLYLRVTCAGGRAMPTVAPTVFPSLSPSTSDAPTANTTGSICRDIVGWVDSYGDNCSWYRANYCTSQYANNGISSWEACCYCGGGENTR